ncbi:MAG: PAS domain S-box protein [Syntrophaceae bacterium]|nr:PAS domain S-box protein [Syntrophaceae bacterium]
MVKIGRPKERELYEALVRTESELRATLNSIDDGVISVDMDGRVILMNPVAEKLTGWGEQEGRGKPLEEVFHIINEETRIKVENPVKRILREGTMIGLANHTLLIGRDGTERAIADCGSPIYDKEGRVTGVVLVFRDETEKRKAEKAVAEALAFAQNIIATVREPLVVLDAGLRILSANRAFYQVFEVMPKETEGCLLYELGNRQWDIPELRKLLEDILPQNTSFNDYEVEHDFPRIGQKTMLLNARRIYREANKTEMILLAIEDITERNQVKKALRESGESFRAVIEKANDGIIIAASDGTHLYANQRASEITGYSVEELLKIGMKGLAHPDEIPKLLERIRKRLSGEEVLSLYETRIVHKDGNTLEIEITGARIYWHGEVADVVIIRDISERKKALEALKASEDKYRALVERSLQGILIVQDFRIVYANERCGEIIGYTVEELLSLSTEKVIALVHPEDQALVWGRFKDRLEGKDVPPHYEYRGIGKDGSTRWLEMFSSLIEYRGKPAVQAAIVDITERKDAEETLRKSEESYKNLVGTARDVIFTLSPDGVITSLNSAFNTITGWSRADWVGKPFNLLIHQDDLSLGMEKFKYSLQGELSKSFELRIRTMPGGYVIGEFVVAPQTQNGKVVNILGIARDITERKRTEEALKKSEERFRKQFEEALDAIFIANAETGILVDCNRAACELVGWEKSELIGRHQRDLHPAGETGEEFSRTFKQHLQEREGRVLETQVITKSGEIKEVAIKANLLEFGDQKVLQGIFRDVTGQKRAEERLKGAYQIIDKSPAVVFVWKNEEGWPVEFVSDNVKEVFGYSAEDFVNGVVCQEI